MKTISLNGTWNLSGARQECDETGKISLKAQVPGCVQLDLAENDYLPKDLYMGLNILETEKYEDYEWWYEKEFTAPKERENVFIVFEGVDCIADYYINGELIGHSENMFIAHEFEISKYLRQGKNTVTVHISSPVVAAHYEDHSINLLTTWLDSVEVPIRKAPHSYGWDIMPRAVTSGLWRDVRIEVRDRIYFSQLYFRTSNDKCIAMYELSCKWSDMQNVELVFEGSCGNDSTFRCVCPVKGKKTGKFELAIPNIKKWWPYGYGDPNVYDVNVQILSHGKIVHEERAQFGIRTVVLDRTDVSDGKHGKFRFLVNGVEIMCKGSNWVPLDAFHSRDAQRYAEALELVKDIGCNILRCWGGNVYEDHAFFDFCDRNGIMVWQDFAMACHIYPETAKFKEKLRREAESVVRKLRNHPSLILWSGDNENDGAYTACGDPNYNSLTREVLRSVVMQNDLDRPYLASSPFMSTEIYLNRRKPDNTLYSPEDHIWGCRDYFKSDYYTNNPAHFVSEVGYHGCPSYESIKKFISPKKVWPYKNNDEWILHSSDQNGDNYRVMLMEKQVRQLFGAVPSVPDNYIIASQISQAEAKKFFIERMRIDRPFKTGIIWWNLIDGWPQMSDAIVDYYFDKKLAYSYIKRSQAPFTMAAGEVAEWGVKVYACNDTLEKKSGSYTVKDAETDTVIAQGSFEIDANCSMAVDKLDIYYSDHKMLIMEWEVNGEKGINHHLCGYPPFSLEQYKKWMYKYGLEKSSDDTAIKELIF